MQQWSGVQFACVRGRGAQEGVFMGSASSGNGNDEDSKGSEDISLETALANLEAGTIEALDFDVLRQTITFRVHQLWFGVHEQHVAIFEDVASFYMILGSDSKRYDWLLKRPATSKTAIGEWTSAYFYPDGVGTVRIHAKPGSWESGWVVRYNTHPNFVVEMGDQQILIEARLVRIDGKTFAVGFVESNESQDE